jgi:hypothetical protein
MSVDIVQLLKRRHEFTSATVDAMVDMAVIEIERLRNYVYKMSEALVNDEYWEGMRLIDDYEEWSGRKYEERFECK